MTSTTRYLLRALTQFYLNGQLRAKHGNLVIVAGVSSNDEITTSLRSSR